MEQLAQTLAPEIQHARDLYLKGAVERIASELEDYFFESDGCEDLDTLLKGIPFKEINNPETGSLYKIGGESYFYLLDCEDPYYEIPVRAWVYDVEDLKRLNILDEKCAFKEWVNLHRLPSVKYLHNDSPRERGINKDLLTALLSNVLGL